MAEALLDMSFLDSSVIPVGLRELWRLNWSAIFNTSGPGGHGLSNMDESRTNKSTTITNTSEPKTMQCNVSRTRVVHEPTTNNEIQKSMKKALSACVLVGVLFCLFDDSFRHHTLPGGLGHHQRWICDPYGYSGYPAYPFGQVGWDIVVPAAQSGSGPPYEGIYVAGGANDANTGYLLPVNTAYYTTMSAGQTGCLYTTAGASGGSGDSIFPAGGINPASYPGGLYLNAEVSTEGTSAVNYFAVQLSGGNWYVSATPMSASEPPYPQFVDVCQEYTTTAGAWNNLTISAPNTVTIGSAAGALSGTITGFGVVQVGPGGWNYNELAITTTCDGLGV